jgi:WD40 repeat protein
MLASGGGDGVVRIWDPETGGQVPLVGHTGKVRGLTAFRDARGSPMLASGGYDHTVRIWDATDGVPVGEPLVGHTAGGIMFS